MSAFAAMIRGREGRQAALMPPSVSGLQGCDLVQGNDMAVDGMIKDNVVPL